MYRYVKRRAVSRRVSGLLGSGVAAPVIAGVVAGIAEQVGVRFIPNVGDEVGLGAAYLFTKNPTIGTILGLRLAQLVPLGFIGGTQVQGTTVGGYA